MLVWRSERDPTGARLSGYLAVMHAMIAGPLLDAQLPDPGAGPGPGPGPGITTAIIERNVCVAAHGLVVSLSVARARQKCWRSLGRSAFTGNVVWPPPSSTEPAETSWVNAWSVATWNS